MIDSITRHPIRDAAVSAGGMTADTRTDGTYTIPTITPGTHSLNVTATGYAWNNNTVVTVSSGVINASGNVTLMPEKVTLTLKSDKTAPIKSAPNSTQVIFNLTATNYGTNATFTVTDSTIVNVTANESTIIGVEIDTGYGIILINVTVEPEGSGKPEIHGGTNATVTTRNITSVDIYTDVLIEDLILRQTDDEMVRKNQSQTINASDTVKCDLTVNMAEPARINITETGINPDGECTESTLPDAVSDWIPVGSFICIRHNTSGTGSFTIRRYYDPSLNYTGVHIYYYNTTPNPSEWERLETTANGTLGGLNWIEAVVNHLSTFVLMGTLGSSGDDGDSDGGDGSGDGTYPPGWFATPTPTMTAAKAPAASATGTATDAPPGRLTQAATAAKTKTAAAEATALAAGATPAKPERHGLPWSTAVFAIVGLLTVVWVAGRLRR